MTDNFQKKDVTEGLARLEKMGLIKKNHPSIKNTGQADPELADFYTITVEGVIYTKKMLRPVLDLLGDSEKAEKIAQRLTDSKTKSWIRIVLKSSAGMIQQQIIEKTIAYGLGNISGLTQLLDLLRKNFQP